MVRVGRSADGVQYQHPLMELAQRDKKLAKHRM
jgi:hypothetical protein